MITILTRWAFLLCGIWILLPASSRAGVRLRGDEALALAYPGCSVRCNLSRG